MTEDCGRPWNKDRVVGSRKSLTQKQTRQIKSILAAKSPHDLCLFLTAIDTMLRASDLLRLRVKDIQLSSGEIKTSFPWRQKKTATGVFPVLTPITQKSLLVWIKSAGKQPADFLFTRQKPSDGAPITIGFYRTLIKSWVTSAGLSPEFYSAHSLRRTKATFLYDHGVSIEIIGRLLGHKSPASTIRYLGIDEAQAREAALNHNIFNSKPTIKHHASLADQLWGLLAPKLDEYLTKNSR